MYNKNNCYVYLDDRAGISHREDSRITSNSNESFKISRTSFDPVQNTFKVKYVGTHF